MQPFARGAHPRPAATRGTNSPSQDKAELRASDLAAPPANAALVHRELHNQPISRASRRPRDVNRCERRRPDQTDDERECEEALVADIHGC